MRKRRTAMSVEMAMRVIEGVNGLVCDPAEEKVLGRSQVAGAWCGGEQIGVFVDGVKPKEYRKVAIAAGVIVMEWMDRMRAGGVGEGVMFPAR